MSRLQPCGTRAAYVRHKRAGEAPCGPCIDANRAHTREATRTWREHRTATRPAAPRRPKRDLHTVAWQWGLTPTTDPQLAQQAAAVVTRHVPAHDVPAVLEALGIKEAA